MTTVAAPTFVCEVCSAPLRYRGGPHRPRWCAEHREKHNDRKKYNATYRARQAARDRDAVAPPVFCERCKTRLLEPHKSGQCGLCLEEQNFLSDLAQARRNVSTTIV